MSDEELISRVSAELNVLLSSFGPPNEAMVQRWPEGLPQYYVGHETMVTNAKSAAAQLGVSLAKVKTDIRRARAALLPLLKQMGFDHE